MPKRYRYPRVRDLREDADMKQKEVGAYLGIKQHSYQRYESGEQNLTLDHAIRPAELYHVSLDYLTENRELIEE